MMVGEPVSAGGSHSKAGEIFLEKNMKRPVEAKGNHLGRQDHWFQIVFWYRTDAKSHYIVVRSDAFHYLCLGE